MSASFLVPSVYATVQLAVDAIPNDLSGEGLNSVVIDKGLYIEDVTVIGFTNTSSSDRVEVIPKAGDQHKGVYGAGVVIRGVSTATAMYTDDNFTKFTDIEIEGDVVGGTTVALGCFDGTSVVYENILVGFTGGVGATGFLAQNVTTGINMELINVYVRNANICYNAFTGTVVYRNCTADGPGSGFERNTATVTYFNCNSIVDGLCFDTGDEAASTNNFSKDTSAPGSNPSISQTIASMNFIDRPNNYNVTSGSVLLGPGIDQSAFYKKDIAGKSIPPDNWPVGGSYFGPPPSTGGFEIGIDIGIG